MNQKGFVKDLVIIILGLAILVGGYFFFFRKTANAPADMVNWKIYRNDEYGFEIKLPPSWESLNNNPVGNDIDFSFRDSKYDGSFEWPGLRISSSSDYSYEYKDVKLSNVFGPKNTKNDVSRIVFYLNQKKFYSSCALYLDSSVIEKCNQILSTFKFTK